MPSFDDIFLQPATRSVLASMNITEPTPIQAGAIPPLLDGKDLVGQSATGSGKTLAYSIPIIERLSKDKREVQALVMVPTRELALQVNTILSKLASRRRMTTALLVGGKAYSTQISALRYGAQIVVGTPGRIKDHLERGTLVMTALRMCVLDEADQMLDIGFAPIIEEILATTPETRQMALFSATMPAWIEKLQEKFLKEPVKIEIIPAEGTQSTIEQIAYKVPQERKMAALCTLLNAAPGESTLIFGRTKFGVEKLGKQLSGQGFTVGTLHGDKSQRARDEILSAFRQGRVQTLLATNVAARGLDIQGIYQVINYELPESSELFTHRVGRTGRMGRQGKAITLLASSEVRKWKRITRDITPAVELEFLAIDEETAAKPVAAKPFVSEVAEDRETRQVTRRQQTFSSERVRSIAPRRQFEDRQERPINTRPQFADRQEQHTFEQAKGNQRGERDLFARNRAKTRPEQDTFAYEDVEVFTEQSKPSRAKAPAHRGHETANPMRRRDDSSFERPARSRRDDTSFERPARSRRDDTSFERPARSRRHEITFEREAHSWQETEDTAPARRRQKSADAYEQPARKADKSEEIFTLPELLRAERMKKGKGTAARQGGASRSRTKSEAEAFVAVKPQARTGGRKFAGKPAARGQRAVAGKRSGRR